MKKAFTLMMLVGVGMLIASLSLASNTGFKLNHPIDYDPAKLNINPTAVPYFSPLIDGTGDSAMILEDIDAGSCAQTLTIRQFDNSLGTRGQIRTQLFSTIGCRTVGVAFEIIPCTGFEIVPTASSTVFNIVGSHDDEETGCAFTAGAGRFNLFTFGIPYHTTWDNSSDVLTDAQVCADNTTLTLRVFRVDSGTRGAYLTHLCRVDLAGGGLCPCIPTGTPIDLRPGEFYELIVDSDTYSANVIAPHY